VVEEILQKGLTSRQLGTTESKRMTMFLKYLLKIFSGEPVTLTMTRFSRKTLFPSSLHGEIIRLRTLPRKNHPKVLAQHLGIPKKNRNRLETLGVEELNLRPTREIQEKSLRLLEMISNRSHKLLGGRQPRKRRISHRISVGVNPPLQRSKRKNQCLKVGTRPNNLGRNHCQLGAISNKIMTMIRT
jgi:hypothetical protein